MMQVEQSQTMDKNTLGTDAKFCLDMHFTFVLIGHLVLGDNALIIDMFWGIIRGWAALILIIFKSSKILPQNGFAKKYSLEIRITNLAK